MKNAADSENDSIASELVARIRSDIENDYCEEMAILRRSKEDIVSIAEGYKGEVSIDCVTPSADWPESLLAVYKLRIERDGLLAKCSDFAKYRQKAQSDSDAWKARVKELGEHVDTIMADRDSVGYQLDAANKKLAMLTPKMDSARAACSATPCDIIRAVNEERGAICNILVADSHHRQDARRPRERGEGGGRGAGGAWSLER